MAKMEEDRKGDILMKPFTLARLLAAGMLLLAVGAWPYSFYTLTRFVTCIVGGYGAYLAAERQHTGWAWALGLTAVVFNPFIPLRLDRATWELLDIAGAAVMAGSTVARIAVAPRQL